MPQNNTITVRMVLMVSLLTGIVVGVSIQPAGNVNAIIDIPSTPSQDTQPPTIYSWNISGEVTEEFTVYCLVIDEGDSGIKNVSLQVNPDNGTIRSYELGHNGTKSGDAFYYDGSIPALEYGDVYDLRIIAYDNAENLRESYKRTFDLSVLPTTIDSTYTMPVVVIGSSIVLGVVVVVAYLYDQKQISDEDFPEAKLESEETNSE
ncbi:MAG: hypothetical protein GF411_03340 [Candidatus Lokiarchaeota archaeon]|nr:hypothetical protein [Candidatus Lokiarchaeota archaeon]